MKTRCDVIDTFNRLPVDWLSITSRLMKIWTMLLMLMLPFKDLMTNRALIVGAQLNRKWEIKRPPCTATKPKNNQEKIRKQIETLAYLLATIKREREREKKHTQNEEIIYPFISIKKKNKENGGWGGGRGEGISHKPNKMKLWGIAMDAVEIDSACWSAEWL